MPQGAAGKILQSSKRQEREDSWARMGPRKRALDRKYADRKSRSSQGQAASDLGSAIPRKPAGAGESPAGLVASFGMCDTKGSQRARTPRTGGNAAFLPTPSHSACTLPRPPLAGGSPHPRLSAPHPAFSPRPGSPGPCFLHVNRSKSTSRLSSWQPSPCGPTPRLLRHIHDKTPRPPVTARPPNPVPPSIVPASRWPSTGLTAPSCSPLAPSSFACLLLATPPPVPSECRATRPSPGPSPGQPSPARGSEHQLLLDAAHAYSPGLRLRPPPAFSAPPLGRMIKISHLTCPNRGDFFFFASLNLFLLSLPRPPNICSTDQPGTRGENPHIPWCRLCGVSQSCPLLHLRCQALSSCSGKSRPSGPWPHSRH